MALLEKLFMNGIQLVAKVESNMKNSLIRFCSKKRALIETVNNEPKDIAQIKRSRHRSFNSFIAN